MAKVKLTDTELVNEHLAKLDPQVKEVVEKIRQIILSASHQIAERIKWNNPSFYYNGPMQAFDAKEYKQDIAVFNLIKNRIMLVLPTGAKLNHASGLLEGDYTDGRRLIVFKDLHDVTTKEAALSDIIKQWVNMVDV